MQQEIALTVQIIRSHLNSSDEEILEALIANGINRHVAVQLVVLLPLAYGRAGLTSSGVRFSDYYTCTNQNGRPGREYKLNSLAVWNESIAFARKEISSGTSGDAVLAIAGRSPETKAINQALHGGEKLEDLVISPPTFIWPEFGTSTQADLCSKTTRRWWQFWKP